MTYTKASPYVLVDVGGGVHINPVEIVALELSRAPARNDFTYIWLRGIAKPLTRAASPAEIMSRCDEAMRKLADGDWP